MRTPQVITQHTPYKLAEIIRDTWPQLYYLKDSTNRGLLRHDLLRIDDDQRISDEVKASNVEKLKRRT